MHYLIYSYFYFINREIDFTKYIHPDVPIEKQFDDNFDEFALIIATMKFEMNHAIEIPDEYLDYKQTLRQLAERIARLPKVDNDKFGTFLLYKAALLRASEEIIISTNSISRNPN